MPEPLRDHAVEPGHFEPLEPGLSLGRVAGCGGDRERQRLDAGAALLERLAVNFLAVEEEDVECDEVRGDLG